MKTIPVTLALGSLELPVDQLTELRPGATISLTEEQIENISLLIAGSQIASGTLKNGKLEISSVVTKLFSADYEQ